MIVEDYEKQIEPELKPLKGWGEWAGAGIAEKKIDPNIELEKKKRQIAQIKDQLSNKSIKSSRQGRTATSTMSSSMRTVTS